jgi:hypothetical protein
MPRRFQFSLNTLLFATCLVAACLAVACDYRRELACFAHVTREAWNEWAIPILCYFAITVGVPVLCIAFLEMIRTYNRSRDSI